MKKFSKKINYDVTQFDNSFFVPYKLKADVRTMIEEKVRPDKVEPLIATLEYISSRVMDSLEDDDREPNKFPFLITNSTKTGFWKDLNMSPSTI